MGLSFAPFFVLYSASPGQTGSFKLNPASYHQLSPWQKRLALCVKKRLRDLVVARDRFEKAIPSVRLTNSLAEPRSETEMKRSCLANPAQLKKTPFSSRPSTEIKFAAGSGGVSDWNWKPGCSADQTIEDVHAEHAKAGPLAVKVHLDRIVPHWDHPEYIVPVNVDVVIMDLFIDAGRSNRTGVKVQSNKGECASMLLAVGSNKLPLAEPHVRLKRKTRHGSTGSVRSHPAAAYVREAHKPVEICDLRRIADVGQCLGRKHCSCRATDEATAA